MGLRIAMLGAMVLLTARCGSEGPTNVDENDPPSIAVSAASAAFVAEEGGADPSALMRSVTNAGDGTLSGLSASVSYPSGQPGGWLSASIGAEAPTELMLSASAAGMAAGSYTASVSVSASGAANSPVVVSVSMTVSAAPGPPPGSPPAAPSELIASAISTSQISLSWTDNADDESGFEIDRCMGAGCTSFAQIGTVGADVTSFQSSGLSASTTYRYRVRATNADGDSDNSNIADATTHAVPAPPAAPSGLSASASSTSQIDLSWTDNADNESGFEIDRCAGAGCTSFAQIGTVGPDVTSFRSTGLSASTTYRFRVRATNGDGDSGNSNIASATTSAAPAPPTAPSGLSATVVSESQIDLSWTDNADNESGFEIDRCAGARCFIFTQIGTVGANVTSFQSRGLTASTTYRYRVRATNGDGDSGNSNIVTATTNAAPTPPAAPSGLTATAVSTSQISLSWTDNANNETGFEIDRCAGAGCTSFTQIGTVGTNVTTYQSSGLSASTTYRYRVRATNRDGDSSNSNIASATTGSSVVEATYLATYDNMLQFNSTDPGPGNTAYPGAENAVGYQYFYDFNGFLTGYLGFAFLVYFDGVQRDLVNSGRTILEARLVLNLYAAQGDPVGNTFRLAAVGNTWNPNAVTWNQWLGMSHYDQTVVNFSPWSSGVVAHEIDVTAIVQNWANGNFLHYGFQVWEPSPTLPGYSSLQAMAYESLEIWNASGRRPMLYVRYQ